MVCNENTSDIIIGLVDGDKLTMINQIIAKLNNNLVAYNKVDYFSKKPGIYAIGCNAEMFPLLSAKDIKKGKIIYIGKTLSSQEKRDEKTHFKSGGTKNSTLRRSLGAILREKLQLIPIPRSYTEKTEKRFTNYCFDERGEKLLTEWMRDNLSLSFWEFEGSVNEIEAIETDIIQQLIPILNLKNNNKNLWKEEIKALRKTCSELAKQHRVSY